MLFCLVSTVYRYRLTSTTDHNNSYLKLFYDSSIYSLVFLVAILTQLFLLTDFLRRDTHRGRERERERERETDRRNLFQNKCNTISKLKVWCLYFSLSLSLQIIQDFLMCLILIKPNDWFQATITRNCIIFFIPF
jgi:hypothetical protein